MNAPILNKESYCTTSWWIYLNSCYNFLDSTSLAVCEAISEIDLSGTFNYLQEEFNIEMKVGSVAQNIE